MPFGLIGNNTGRANQTLIHHGSKCDTLSRLEVAMLTNEEDLGKLDAKDLVSVCSSCMKVRDPFGKWIDPRVFFLKYFSGGQFTHTICEQCCNQHFPDFARDFYETSQQPDTAQGI